jgi:hypothetical protein
MKHGQGLLVATVVVLSLLFLALLAVLAAAVGRGTPHHVPGGPPPPPHGSPGPAGGGKKGVCVFDLDGTLLGAAGAKPEDQMASICANAGFDVAVVTAGGTGAQRAGEAASKLGITPADFKFCTQTHGSGKGEVISGQLAKCYPPGEIPPRVILFDDNPDFSKSARDWGFCSPDEQSAAIRANNGVNAEIVRKGIASCAPWPPPLKPASASTQTGRACLKEIT